MITPLYPHPLLCPLIVTAIDHRLASLFMTLTALYSAIYARKGSVYDLKEFLSLGNAVDSNSLSTSENSSRSTSPQIVFSPLNAKQLLSFTQPTEARRSSTYDLMEFLSLPQSGGISRPHSGQSYSSSQGDNAKSDNRELNVTETDRDGREARSLSVYGLAEYLAMTSGVPPLVRIISSVDDQTEKTNSKSLGASGVDNGNTHKRESVYDLRKILNIMQQEHEFLSLYASPRTRQTISFCLRLEENFLTYHKAGLAFM